MCFYPSLIQNRRYIPNKKNGGIIPVCKDERLKAVPIGCGRCMECRKQEARKWQVRLLEDVRHNKNGKFVTLTFSDESIKELTKEISNKKTKKIIGTKQYVDKNGKLKKRYTYEIIETEVTYINGYETDNAIAKIAVRKFLERWRKKHKTSARHWLITELGHQGTENIHLHGIIWTNEDMKEIEKHWKYGYVWTGEEDANGKITNYVNEETVNYLTKYVHKQDFKYTEYKPKVLTSAGIGAGYLERTDWLKNKYIEGKTKEYWKSRTGHKIAMPNYWRNKIYSEDERENLWLEKLDKEERWVGGEKVSVADGMKEYYGLLEYHRARNIRLGYQTDTVNWNQKKYEEDRRNMLIQKRIGEENAPQVGERPPMGGEHIRKTYWEELAEPEESTIKPSTQWN